jgi:hypothetical protein
MSTEFLSKINTKYLKEEKFDPTTTFLSEVKTKHLKKGKIFWTFNPTTKNLISFKLVEDIRYDYNDARIYDSEGFYAHVKSWLKIKILYLKKESDLYASVISSRDGAKSSDRSIIYPIDCVVTNRMATLHFKRRMAKKALKRKTSN